MSIDMDKLAAVGDYGDDWCDSLHRGSFICSPNCFFFFSTSRRVRFTFVSVRSARCTGGYFGEVIES